LEILQRCPPVWENNARYLGGSYVSVHGIAYQAFHYADPGMDPQRNSGPWQSWKKLGPCRLSYVNDDPEGAIKEALAILDEIDESEQIDLIDQLEQLLSKEEDRKK